ncbi:MAG: hypothetical protein JSR99_03410 [Proteobacteria bacterium]|nr:hypothetical protein [Pseudomonadota bacterium]
MRKRLLQRFFFLLGMVAMLGALLSMPLTATYAFAMSGHAASIAMDAPHGMDMSAAKTPMPCDGPAKHCPDCPQKVCPEMGSCLVKCFQPLPAPLAEARLRGEIVHERVAPGHALITAGSLIPPLLRPPSV